LARAQVDRRTVAPGRAAWRRPRKRRAQPSALSILSGLTQLNLRSRIDTAFVNTPKAGGPMNRISTRRARTVAVLGSIAALGGGATAVAATSGGSSSPKPVYAARQADWSAGAGSPLTAGERTALEAVQKAVNADTTSIATPVLSSAVSAGTITAAQEQDLLTLLAESPSGAGPGPGGFGGARGHGAMGAPPTGTT
jgi:hypothetical protein